MRSRAVDFEHYDRVAAAFSIVGVPQILVQMPRVRRLELDTAFWRSTILGAAITALLIA